MKALSEIMVTASFWREKVQSPRGCKEAAKGR